MQGYDERAILFKTDNEDFPYCVQIHSSTDGGKNYFLRACRYFEKKAWAVAFAQDMGFEIEGEEPIRGFLTDE